MEQGFEACVSDSEDENTAPDGFDDALCSTIGWISLHESKDIPPLNIKHIHEYFITRRLKKELVTATKPFEKGYRLFDASKVKAPSINHLQQDSLFCIIKATVLPTQRHDRTYLTSIAVNKTSGIVLHGTCTCTAGKCGSCNHVAALMFLLDDWNRKNSTKEDKPTCTSLPAQWNVPRRQSAEAMRVSELNIVKPEFGKVKEARDPAAVRSMNPVIGQVTMERIQSLRADLSQNHSSSLLLHHVWPDNPDEDQIKRLKLTPPPPPPPS